MSIIFTMDKIHFEKEDDMSKEKELVSVVIPTYNRRNNLERSLGSVLRQSYDNMEILIVDDGSDDGTEEYVKSIGDPRVFYYKNATNMGPSASRNRGASLAKGAYIAFQDSDDEWLPEKLEKMMNILESAGEHVGLAYHEMQEAEGKGEIIPSRNIPVIYKNGYIYRYMLLYPLISPQACVFRKECFEKCGGFQEALSALEDYELFLRVAENYEICFLGEPLVMIYDTPGSVNKRWHGKIDTEIYVMDTMYGSLKQYNLLEQKMDLVRLQAENYGCEDYFYEKMLVLLDNISKSGKDEHKRDELWKALDNSATKVRTVGCDDRSIYYQNAAGQIRRLKESLLSLYGNIKKNAVVLVSNYPAICAALRDVIEDMKAYADLTRCPMKERDSLAEWENMLSQGVKEDGKRILQQVLEALIDKCEAYLGEMESAKCICTNCGADVRFLPPTPYRKILRKHYGKEVQTTTYLFEEERNRCPLCGATEEIRFLVGFLEDIQPEEDERLKVCCVLPEQTPLKNVPQYVQQYIRTHDYMECGGNYRFDENCAADVLIVLDVFDGTNDDSVLKQIRKKVKVNGICIFMMSEIADEEALLEMFERCGLEVQCIDQNWFGTEYYTDYGFAQSSKMYMASM